VSPWRGDIDWQKVAGVQGPGRVLFASLKASGADAHGGLAEHWAREAPEMKVSGIPLLFGCHRLHIGGVAAQVEEFIAAMTAGLGGYVGYGVHLDAEAADPASIIEWMARWNDRTQSYPVTGYLPRWKETQWANSSLGAYGFRAWWASRYVQDLGTPLALLATVPEEFWAPHDGVEPTILQYSASSIVDGVNPPTDVNTFRGEIHQLRNIVTRDW
jgi:hypothetical protein